MSEPLTRKARRRCAPAGLVTFDPYDQQTWPPTLTADMVAAIYVYPTVRALQLAVDRGFEPAPFRKRPIRWRKADVLADIAPVQSALRMHKVGA